MSQAAIEIPDQPLATRVLRGVMGRPHVPQQFLMFGPPGTGKRHAARDLAFLLMGVPREQWDRPSLDMSVVRASGQQILLEELEDALRDLAARPQVATCRAVIVEGAERLNNPTVGNRLLKPLEEPPPGSRVILVTDRPEDLLPTLRSRCVPVPFRHPGWKAIAARAVHHGLDPAAAEALARSVGTRAVAADAFFLAMHEIGVEFGFDVLEGRRPAGAVIAAAQAAMEDAAARNPSSELRALRAAAAELEGKRGEKTAVKRADDQEKRERRRAVTDGWGYVMAAAAGVVADALAVSLGAPAALRHPALTPRLVSAAAPAAFCARALEDIEHTRGELRLNPTVDVAARAMMSRIDLLRAGVAIPPTPGRLPYV